ncbi:hypothetical protein OSSY52_08260 [Tepiditoga spiralis]|uniref:DUF3783 domain-containing protein n=1 Tax=Tepiditoga spiralis TaxID=2108365 RepID=A0A7G1G3R2_9BACT|nr:DUF3783 domain-containing protein [Tepiditoga spiralis]BBE30685.1 hypothetical protein OSSY52_08260 [Tepiditoga spiralis]
MSDISTIIMDGFTNEQTLKIMRAIKSLEGMPEIIFATVTETSKKWTVEELIKELNLEHEEMKKYKENKK